MTKISGSKTSKKGMLQAFLRDIQMFLGRHSLGGVLEGTDQQLRGLLQFSNVSYRQDFIEKLLEIT